MPKTHILLILSAGILFVSALLAYTCCLLVGRTQYLNPWAPKGVRRGDQQHSRALRQQVDEKFKLESEESNNGVHLGVVKKQAFSSKMRMIFAVGLEGTGHHFVHPVLKSVCELETVMCPNMCGDMFSAIFNLMGTPETTSDYKTGLALLQKEMEALAVTADGLNGTAVFATFAPCVRGQLSYPNDRGPDKPLQYVDVKILAREAERAGIDLRLLYLGRKAKDILISDTQHRDFGGGFTHEARILINNAAVIGSTFQEVDPAFVTCISFPEVTTDPAQAARIAKVVVPAPGVAKQISENILTLADIKGHTKDPWAIDDQEGWNLMANRLQEKLDEIERIQC